jgi:DAACS family dicarboxylate/amino acid:cation (Na+ or H+) symporter
MERQTSLPRWILVGLLVGVLAGLLDNWLTSSGGPFPLLRAGLEEVVRNLIQPLGGIFLRLLFMTVLPLVFSCLTLGVRELGDLRHLGRIGLKTLAFTLVLSAVSVLIGLSLVNTVEPGSGLDPAMREEMLAEAQSGDPDAVRKAAAGSQRPWLEVLVHAVIPRNPLEAAVRAFEGEMLAVMFFALVFGAALGAGGSAPVGGGTARTATIVAWLEGLYDVSMRLVRFALWLAPVGVAALVFSMASRMGFDLVVTLGTYMLTVLAGLALQLFVVYPLVLRLLCRQSPWRFFARIREVMVTAFSTSSSNATLPTTLRVAREELRIAPKVANFVLTLGSTLNQNGTALFEGVTVLFIAQLYGVELSLDSQLLVVGMSVLAGVGTAGVPSGSLPLIVPVLVSVGVPGEGIAVILGVDRLLDMCRTVLNVTGDLVAASWVARGEGEEEQEAGTGTGTGTGTGGIGDKRGD